MPKRARAGAPPPSPISYAADFQSTPATADRSFCVVAAMLRDKWISRRALLKLASGGGKWLVARAVLQPKSSRGAWKVSFAQHETAGPVAASFPVSQLDDDDARASVCHEIIMGFIGGVFINKVGIHVKVLGTVAAASGARVD